MEQRRSTSVLSVIAAALNEGGVVRAAPKGHQEMQTTAIGTLGRAPTDAAWGPRLEAQTTATGTAGGVLQDHLQYLQGLQHPGRTTS